MNDLLKYLRFTGTSCNSGVKMQVRSLLFLSVGCCGLLLGLARGKPVWYHSPRIAAAIDGSYTSPLGGSISGLYVEVTLCATSSFFSKIH